MLPRLPHPCFPHPCLPHPCLPHPRLTLTLTRLPCVAKPFDPDDSNLDEIVGYVLAAAGFVFQLQAGFALVFPLNLVLLPLTTVEWGSTVRTPSVPRVPRAPRAPLGPRVPRVPRVPLGPAQCRRFHGPLAIQVGTAMADCDGHERTECLARAKLHLAPVKYNLTSEVRGHSAQGQVNVRKELRRVYYPEACVKTVMCVWFSAVCVGDQS